MTSENFHLVPDYFHRLIHGLQSPEHFNVLSILPTSVLQLNVLPHLTEVEVFESLIMSVAMSAACY